MTSRAEGREAESGSTDLPGSQAGAGVEGLLPPLTLGNIEVDPPLMLAPMHGVTDASFRALIRHASGDGVGLFYSEFAAAEGIIRSNPRAMRAITPQPEDRPFTAQIHGRNPEPLARAAVAAAETGADLIDLNCGCPAKAVVRQGSGVALMREPDLIGRLVEAVKAAVELPVTVKIRSGWSDSSLNAMEVSRIAQEAGACMVCIHGRTRDQRLAEEADWELVAEVGQKLRVPVVGSGDVTSGAEALERLRMPGVAGVMIGRGAMANPWVFGDTLQLAARGQTPHHSLDDRLSLVLALAELGTRYLPERALPGRLKQLIGPITRGFPGGAAIRRAVYVAQSPAEIVAVIGQLRRTSTEETAF